MAVRLGSALSDAEGNPLDYLHINSGETGFTFEAPAALSSYTVTNDTSNRIINATDVTLDSLANTLSTLIRDMTQIYTGVPGAFQWSTDEQVWPFEKDVDGNTLYAKLYIAENFGPTTGFYPAHGLASAKYVQRVHAVCTNTNDCALPGTNGTNFSYTYGIDVTSTQIRVAYISNQGQAAGTLKVFTIYRK